jgi:hypothetical protein
MTEPLFEEGPFTIVAPSKQTSFHPTQDFMIFGYLFVTFDSMSDPIFIATLYSYDVKDTAGVGFDGIGLKSQIHVVPVEDITVKFKSFSFSPNVKANEKEEYGSLRVGDSVVRGKHWKWGNQDGEGKGTVIEEIDDDEWVGVEWENGNKNKQVR